METSHESAGARWWRKKKKKKKVQVNITRFKNSIAQAEAVAIASSRIIDARQIPTTVEELNYQRRRETQVLKLRVAGTAAGVQLLRSMIRKAHPERCPASPPVYSHSYSAARLSSGPGGDALPIPAKSTCHSPAGRLLVSFSN